MTTRPTLELPPPAPEKPQVVASSQEQTNEPEKKGIEWREVLRTAGLAAVLFVALFWGADCRCMGRVSDSLADIQDKTLDYLSRLEYLRTGPTPPPGLPQAILVQLDDTTVSKFSPGSYVFHRESLTQLLTALEADKPRAVFLDLDLTRPSNEPRLGERNARANLSAGDQTLLAYLERPRGFPLLLNTTSSLPKTQLFGLPIQNLKLQDVCFVSPTAIRDQDNLVRRIPRWVDTREVAPASDVLYRYSRAESDPCPLPVEAKPGSVYRTGDSYGGIGNRMIFREPELWQGFGQVSAASVLANETLGLFSDAVVLVGRTDREAFDDHLTPVGRFPGVYVHVNELMTLSSFGRKVTPITPLLGVPLAFMFTLLSLVLTPLLIGALTRWLERRFKLKTELENFLERPLIWMALFVIAAVMLHEYGLFVDFAFPILALELARLVTGRNVQALAGRMVKWGLRR